MTDIDDFELLFEERAQANPKFPALVAKAAARRRRKRQRQEKSRRKLEAIGSPNETVMATAKVLDTRRSRA